MKKLIWVLLPLSFLILLIGCAATYKPPTISTQSVIDTFHGSKSDLFNVAKQILIMEGYQIINSDEKSGTISTAPKRMSLDETYCDCGSTMGLSYIKDKRTVTTVSLGLLILEGKIRVKANIEGEYLKTDKIAGVSMVCISTGKTERDLIRKIKDKF